MHKISWTALLLLLVVSGMAVSAQSKNGALTTTVLDQNKAVLRGTSLTLTDLNTNTVRKCVSNEKGECKFEVPAGTYELKTQSDLFCPLTVSGIRLKENETVPVELNLEPINWKDPGSAYEQLIKSLGL